MNITNENTATVTLKIVLSRAEAKRLQRVAMMTVSIPNTVNDAQKRDLCSDEGELANFTRGFLHALCDALTSALTSA